MTPEIIRTRNFAGDAAQFILQQARLALGERGEFRLSLSGGKTPQPIYSELARIGSDLPWERIFITFGDERCVPPDHEESNYRMARESLLIPASVPERSVARMHGEIDPQLAAQEYEDQLGVLAAQKGEMIFRHDLILLGVGDDGHTASLFPGTAALDEHSRRVVANHVPKLDTWRLTFTYPLIAQARHICFTADATKKSDIIDKVLAENADYPASRVHRLGPPVTWIIAEAA
jgi:6-phosphogluconolactonase